MGDTFDVRVVAIEGATIDLDIRPTGAAGLIDQCITRSFALGLLCSATRPRLHAERTAQRVLRTEVGDDEEHAYDETWVAENIDRLVESTRILSERNRLDEDVLGPIADALALHTPENDAKRWEQLYSYRFRIVMTRPELLAGIAVGDTFGTAATEVWWDDPKRPD